MSDILYELVENFNSSENQDDKIKFLDKISKLWNSDYDYQRIFQFIVDCFVDSQLEDRIRSRACNHLVSIYYKCKSEQLVEIKKSITKTVLDVIKKEYRRNESLTTTLFWSVSRLEPTKKTIKFLMKTTSEIKDFKARSAAYSVLDQIRSISQLVDFYIEQMTQTDDHRIQYVLFGKLQRYQNETRNWDKIEYVCIQMLSGTKNNICSMAARLIGENANAGVAEEEIINQLQIRKDDFYLQKNLINTLVNVGTNNKLTVGLLADHLTNSSKEIQEVAEEALKKIALRANYANIPELLAQYKQKKLTKGEIVAIITFSLSIMINLFGINLRINTSNLKLASLIVTYSIFNISIIILVIIFLWALINPIRKHNKTLLSKK